MSNDNQIKSRLRVKELAEVFTNQREVDDMLSLVDDFTKNSALKESLSYRLATTFLEPACGTGNFLVEILQRKLQTAAIAYQTSNKSQLDIKSYQFSIFQAISSIYGIDIDIENVKTSRQRMLDIIVREYEFNLSEKLDKNPIPACFSELLISNIVLGDSLLQKETIKFLDYSFIISRFAVSFSVWSLKDIENRNNIKVIPSRAQSFILFKSPNTNI